MRNIILASSGFEKNKELKNDIFSLLTKEISESSVVIITTASVEWKERNKHAVLAKQVFEESGFKNVDFIDIEFDNPMALNNYDIVYINGGNPFYLLFHLKKSNADSVIINLAKRGVIIVGVSAGAVVLGPDIKIVDFLEKEINIMDLGDLEGLNLANTRVCPHYVDPMEEKIKMFEDENKLVITRLSDSQSLIIKK